MKLEHTMMIVLALLFSASPSFAQGKMAPQSPQRTAALRRCYEQYYAALKQAKTKQGQERKDAFAAAKKAQRECLVNTPQ